jgi:hypothetical protein
MKSNIHPMMKNRRNLIRELNLTEMLEIQRRLAKGDSPTLIKWDCRITAALLKTIRGIPAQKAHELGWLKEETTDAT